MLPLAEHLGAQPEWLLRQRSEPIWTTEPKQARALVEEHNTLQQLRAQLNLDRAASQKPDPLNLDLAQEQLQRCCDRGLSAVLAQPNAEQQWGQQIVQAQALLQSADQGLRLCLPQSLESADRSTPGTSRAAAFSARAGRRCSCPANEPALEH